MVVVLALEAGAAFGVIQSGLIPFEPKASAEISQTLDQRISISDVKISPPVVNNLDRGYARIALSLTNKSQEELAAVSIKASFNDRDGMLLGAREFVPHLASEDKRRLLPGDTITSDQMVLDVPLRWSDARIGLTVASVIPVIE